MKWPSSHIPCVVNLPFLLKILAISLNLKFYLSYGFYHTIFLSCLFLCPCHSLLLCFLLFYPSLPLLSFFPLHISPSLLPLWLSSPAVSSRQEAGSRLVRWHTVQALSIFYPLCPDHLSELWEFLVPPSFLPPSFPLTPLASALPSLFGACFFCLSILFFYLPSVRFGWLFSCLPTYLLTCP